MHDLNSRVPRRPRARRTAACDARLDDIIFREVSDHPKQEGTPSPHEDLYDLYHVPPHLPRLSELTSSLANEINLSDTIVVAHQHILGSVVSQFEALWQLGLRHDRTFIVGKPYSTNRLAAQYFRDRGCHVQDGFAGFNTGAILSPGWYQNANALALGTFFARVLSEVTDTARTTLIVIDDGGLILNWLDHALESDLFTSADADRLTNMQVVGVEQTTFGRHLLERNRHLKVASSPSNQFVPIANVAQTRLKLEQETELIAQSIVHELDGWLRCSDAQSYHVQTLRDARVGVIGFGVVGSWVCRRLNHEVERLSVFDPNVSHSSIARSFGYHVVSSLAELAKESTVIVGCSGARDGVKLEANMLSAGTVLASGSSGNYEFARAFITAGDARRRKINPDITKDRAASAFDWVHSIFSIPAVSGDAFVLNGGFPVNFTGGVDPIRPEDIELTRCLMVSGVAAALRELGAEPNFGGAVRLANFDETRLVELFDL